MQLHYHDLVLVRVICARAFGPKVSLIYMPRFLPRISYSYQFTYILLSNKLKIITICYLTIFYKKYKLLLTFGQKHIDGFRSNRSKCKQQFCMLFLSSTLLDIRKFEMNNNAFIIRCIFELYGAANFKSISQK